jgi:hypothetical protein
MPIRPGHASGKVCLGIAADELTARERAVLGSFCGTVTAIARIATTAITIATTIDSQKIQRHPTDDATRPPKSAERPPNRPRTRSTSS